MKKIILVLCALLLVGCGKKDEQMVDVPKPDNKDIVITTPETTPTTNQEGNDSSQTYHVYSGYGVVDADYTFFTEGNKCLVDNYMIVKIMKVSQEKDEIGMEIGSHCYDENDVQGGVTNMKLNRLKEIPSFDINVGKLYKLYYELPEEFEPTTYLNYVDYATKLEEIE